jgi:hypothetical protein
MFMVINIFQKGASNFCSFWHSSFREEDFLEIDQSKTRIACGSHVCKRIKTK